jgi:hypothetical protein
MITRRKRGSSRYIAAMSPANCPFVIRTAPRVRAFAFTPSINLNLGCRIVRNEERAYELSRFRRSPKDPPLFSTQITRARNESERIGFVLWQLSRCRLFARRRIAALARRELMSASTHFGHSAAPARAVEFARFDPLWDGELVWPRRAPGLSLISMGLRFRWTRPASSGARGILTKSDGGRWVRAQVTRTHSCPSGQ